MLPKLSSFQCISASGIDHDRDDLSFHHER